MADDAGGIRHTAKARPPERARQASRELGYTDIYNVDAMGSHPVVGLPTGTALLYELWRMSVTDETVGAMFFCIMSILGQVDWKHVPEVNGKLAENDAEAVRLAEWADTLLVDMDHTMQEHVEEATSMITFGFAPCEIVTKVRDGVGSKFNDKFYGIKKLPLRDQLGIYNWRYEGNDAVSFTQNGVTGTAEIPLWKTLHYRTISRLDKPMGRPLLLNALRPWKYKEKIQDGEAIGIERDLAGVPVFRVPQEVLDATKDVDADNQPTPEAAEAIAKVQAAIRAVKDMRFNQSAGLVMPSDTFFEETADGATSGDRTPKWDFKLVTTAGQRTIDARTAIRDYDRAIARVIMMQFLHLGDRSTGSYALSDDQSSMAVRALMAIAMKIAGEWNRKLIKLLWDINGFDKSRMPRLRASEISKDNIAQIGQLMAGLGRAGGLWESDAEMRFAIAKLANLPVDREAQRTAAQRAAKKAETEAMPKPVATPAPANDARPKAAAMDDDPDLTELGHNGGPPMEID